MKRISLLILTVFAIGSAMAQSNEDFGYEPITATGNMSVVIQEGLLNNFIGDDIQAYAVKYVYAGPADHLLGIPPIDSTITPTSQLITITESTIPGVSAAAGIVVMGADEFCNCGDVQAETGDVIRFFIRSGEGDDIVFVQVNLFPELTELTYTKDGFYSYYESISFSIDGDPVVYGCKDSNYLEFDASANIDDGSCVTVGVWGCTDSEANNFNTNATHNDGSCVYFSPIVYQLIDNWNMVGFTAEAAVDLGNTMPERVQGLIDVVDLALGAGTTVSTFQVIKNVSGQFWSETASLLSELVPGEGYQMYVKPGNATTITFSETFVPNIEYQLIDNWNMVGFTAPDTVLFGNSISEKIQGLIDVMDLAIDGNTIETFQVIKNVSGQFWSETASLLGGLIPGEGYQMYVKPGNATTINFYQEE